MKIVGEELNKLVDKANGNVRQRYHEQMKEFHEELMRLRTESPDATVVEPVMPLEPVYYEKYNERNREGCGLQGDVSGYLLCPVEFDWDDLE